MAESAGAAEKVLETAAAANEAPADAGAGVAVAVGGNGLASVGSQKHAETIEGQPACTPCAWFHKPAGCLNAENCHYCHLCPPEELKNRKKSKVQRMKTKELEAKATAPAMRRAKTGLPGSEPDAAESMHLRRANTMPNSAGDETPAAAAGAGDGKQAGKLLLPGVGNTQEQQLTVSEGSALHGKLDANGLPRCHPCAWYHKSNCKNDKDCIFCHLCPPGELKNRKKLKIAKLRGTDGATPSPASPSPAAVMSAKSDKRVQRSSTDPARRAGGGTPMWPSSPFDAAGGGAGMMPPPYGMFGFNPSSPWPYVDPVFGYDPRFMMGMPPPSPGGMSPDMGAMMSMASSVPSMKDPNKTPIAGRLRDEPPGLSLPPEAPEGKITRINWSVDIRNLRTSNKKASSPAFQVPGASGSFRMALLPKGGVSFVEAAMHGSIQVFREEISDLLPGFVSMQISVTRVGQEASSEEKEPPVGPLKHDFAQSNIFELPAGLDDFDLEAIASDSRAVNICLEILPPDAAATLQ